MMKSGLFAACTVLSACACDVVSRIMPERVADTVARLSVRNAAALIRLVEEDKDCGFESVWSKTNVSIEGDQGAPAARGMIGAATWKVDACEMDLGVGQVLARDCHGNTLIARGRVIVSAKRSINGWLTGDSEKPVMPESPASIEYSLNVRSGEGFRVESSADKDVLELTRGGFRIDATPQLAKSQTDSDKGFCVVPTELLAFSRLRYENALVHVINDYSNTAVPIKSSQLEAYQGKHEQAENHISGKITLWGDDVRVPVDKHGLDPNYSSDKFVSSFSCHEQLAGVVDFQCDSPVVLFNSGSNDNNGNDSISNLRNEAMVKDFIETKIKKHVRSLAEMRVRELPKSSWDWLLFWNAPAELVIDKDLGEVEELLVNSGHIKAQVVVAEPVIIKAATIALVELSVNRFGKTYQYSSAQLKISNDVVESFELK